MSGFSNYKRTLSKGSEGAVLTMKFTGSGFCVFGENDGNCMIYAIVDGRNAEKLSLPVSGSREIIYGLSNLQNSNHTVRITVLSGVLNIDGVQVEGEWD